MKDVTSGLRPSHATHTDSPGIGRLSSSAASRTGRRRCRHPSPQSWARPSNGSRCRCSLHSTGSIAAVFLTIKQGSLFCFCVTKNLAQQEKERKEEEEKKKKQKKKKKKRRRKEEEEKKKKKKRRRKKEEEKKKKKKRRRKKEEEKKKKQTKLETPSSPLLS